MRVNEKKLQRQLSIIDKWMRAGCKGTVEACTGFGKTYILILVIQRLHKKYPNAPIDVVVPKLSLLDDWVDPERGHIVKHGLRHVNVFVVNTYIKFERRFPALIGLDEIHNYASDEFGKVFEVAGVTPYAEETGTQPFALGLSATVERLDGKHVFIEKYCPIVDTVTLEEAKKEGYISNFKTFNLGLNFNKEEQERYNELHTLFNKAFAKFEHNFEMAMACAKGMKFYTKLSVPVKRRDNQGGFMTVNVEYTKNGPEWCMWQAMKMGYEGQPEDDFDFTPKKISAYAQHFSNSMRKRKQMIVEADTKIEAIEEILDKFPVKAMSFCETQSFADRVAEKLGQPRCKAYHTGVKGRVERVELISKKGIISYKNKRISAEKVKAEILRDFLIDDLFQLLSTVKAMDEGYDNEKVKMAIKASYDSSKRRDTQTTGRASRLDIEDDEKIAIVVNLYMIGSQEEKWLKAKQHGLRDVKWITSVDEITLEGDIVEGSITLV